MATDAAQGKHSSNFRTDLRNLAATGFRRLAGFKRKGTKSTVSVNPGTINGGATGTVDVTVTGVLTTAKHQKVVAAPPSALEVGLRFAGVKIQATNTVRITLENTTGSPIDGAARNWDLYFFDGGN